MIRAALLALALTAAAGAAAATEPANLERVVMLMRHGVRPPTKAEVTPPGWAAQAWPAWSTGYGELTPHGAEGARLMGRYDRQAYAAKGLLRAEGCAQPGDIVAWASGKRRAIDTAKAYVEAMFPGCGVVVGHPVDEANDPIFHPLDSGSAIDGERARGAAAARLPAGGLAAVHAQHAADFVLLQKVLGKPDPCAAPSCSLADLPSTLEGQLDDGPDLGGALGVASTAGSTLMLAYVEGKPLAEVGWGRASRSDLTQLLRFHTTKFYYEARTPYVADRAAAPIARRVLAALNGAPDAGRLTLLVGHDTNIAQLGGMLDLHWTVGDYPTDDPPPGGALGFELWRDAAGPFVRAFYQAQTMDQLRNLTPLTSAAPPARVDVPIGGCTVEGTGRCSLAGFEALVRGKLAHPAP